MVITLSGGGGGSKNIDKNVRGWFLMTLGVAIIIPSCLNMIDPVTPPLSIKLHVGL